MHNITIIGTSHIAHQSLKEVREAIEQLQPDIVALELDGKRFPALFAKKRRGIHLSDVYRVGLKGFLFAVLGAWAERKLGEAVGVKPGAEMKAAVMQARKQKAEIMLIDQDIEITLKRLSASLTWREKWNFMADLLRGIASRRPEFSFDLRTVPEEEIIRKMVGRLRERYPSVYHVLIEERNAVMAANIRRLAHDHPEKKIVAVVGAGHKEGLLQMLRSSDISVSYTLPQGLTLQ